MKRALLVLTLVAACVAVLGLYMGWFRVSSGSSDGKSNVTLTVDNDQIQKDKDRAVDNVKGDSQPK